jgi:hypothetical protein
MAPPLVEFAVVGLLFFTLLFGIIEIGLLIYNQQVVTNAGREGARHGIVARPSEYKITKTDIIGKVTDYAEANIVSFGNKAFDVDVQFFRDEKLIATNFCGRFRDRLTVDVTYDYSFLFLPFAKKTLGTKAVMICE